MKEKGISIIKLKGPNLNPETGGVIKIIYLKEYKIIGSSIYRSIPLKIKKSEGRWNLYYQGTIVKNFNVTPYTWGVRSYTFD